MNFPKLTTLPDFTAWTDTELFLAVDNARPGSRYRAYLQEESDRRHAAARATYRSMMAEVKAVAAAYIAELRLAN